MASLDPSPGVDPDAWMVPKTPEAIVAWTRTLTDMRRRMAAETDARVVLGGPRVSAGLYPGLAEEARLHLRAGKPVYLLGGYGGVTADLIAALHGRKADALTEARQLSDKKRRQARALYDRGPTGPYDVEQWARDLAALGPAGLAKLNGLSEADNQRLFTTRSTVEQVALVLKGLRKLARG